MQPLIDKFVEKVINTEYIVQWIIPMLKIGY